jgi:hypothetical protein
VIPAAVASRRRNLPQRDHGRGDLSAMLFAGDADLPAAREAEECFQPTLAFNSVTGADNTAASTFWGSGSSGTENAVI